MNFYFCPNCIVDWERGTFMKSCIGCEEHHQKGWTSELMLSVYRPLIDRYGKAYFPTIHRELPPPRKIFSLYNYFSEANKMLEEKAFLPEFVVQQKECIEVFKRYPTKENWDVLDPLVQDKIKLIFRY